MPQAKGSLQLGLIGATGKAVNCTRTVSRFLQFTTLQFQCVQFSATRCALRDLVCKKKKRFRMNRFWHHRFMLVLGLEVCECARCSM